MKPIMIAAASALLAGALAAGVAFADNTVGEPGVVVKSGMWDWRQKTSVLGITVSDKKSKECMIEEEVNMTLADLAYDLDPSCTVNTVTPAAGGYDFKLLCGGEYPGKADANIVHTSQSLAMSAKGSVKWNGIPAGFSWKASATYAGECTPDEYAKQKAKWEAKQAQR
jgi:hypothetical protein